MKKNLSIVVAVILLCTFAFVGCGNALKDSEYLGTWECTKVSLGGKEKDYSVVEKNLGGKLTMTLYENGSVDGDFASFGNIGDNWEETDSGIKIDNDELSRDNDRLIFESEGVQLIFEKIE